MATDNSWGNTDPRELLRGTGSRTQGCWRVMGIVKDWVGPNHQNRLSVQGQGPTIRRQPSLFRGMLANLKALHKCGIVVCDVRAEQWVDGTLVDLSCAMTIPHMYEKNGILPRPSWTFMSMAAWDLRCFQIDVINGWNDFKRLQPGVPPPRRKSQLHVYDIQEPYNPWQVSAGRRPRRRNRPKPYGPFLPLLNPRGLGLDLIQLPEVDPAKVDWKRD